MVKNNNEITLKLYSPEEINKRFDQILEELKGENDVCKINKKIAKSFGGFLLNTIELPPNSVKIYRVTKNYHRLEEKKHLLSSFLNPPPEETPLGRANLENFPVFYGSYLSRTAIDESNLKIGETFYLSEWILPLKTKVNAFVLAYDTKNREGFLEQITDNSINKLFSNSLEEKYAAKYTQKRVNDLFTYNGSQYYNISSAIAHQYLYLYRDKIVETPIIIYPSVKKKGNEYNFAIHPSFVSNEDKFRLISVLKCENVSPHKKPIIHEKGIKENNKISWRKYSDV